MGFVQVLELVILTFASTETDAFEPPTFSGLRETLGCVEPPAFSGLRETLWDLSI